MKSKHVFPALLVAGNLAVVLPAAAVTGTLNTTIVRTMATGENAFGGCMARAANPIASATNTPKCRGNWVTFSCTGIYTSKDMAFLAFDQAQLALTQTKKVILTVDDTRKHNGQCFASRVDVLR